MGTVSVALTDHDEEMLRILSKLDKRKINGEVGWLVRKRLTEILKQEQPVFLAEELEYDDIQSLKNSQHLPDIEIPE